MRKSINGLLILLFLTALNCVALYAQSTTGSIAGTVVDQNGEVVPNATVTVKGTSGQQLTSVSSDNGTYKIPAVSNGIYTVTVKLEGFKSYVVSNVKVDVGLPTTVDAVLQIGEISEVVEVSSGGEVLQTQTATVGTTITGRQITESPLPSRDALDLVLMLPGTATVGAPRRSSINGLPKGALTITIDGVDVQDNRLRSSDGYFTYVRPRVDAIEEVTVSTSNPGAESSGDGAVQIKFVTKRGTNQYHGGLYWQHRNTALNAAYWYNNRDLPPDPGTGKAPRNTIILNQYGGTFGGPLPFPHFGEGGPVFNSGKDRAFFFVNYEEFRQPASQTRTRNILSTQAQSGIYQYVSGGVTRSVNLYTIAAANNQLSTPDPTVTALLTQIRNSTSSAGSITSITNQDNVERFNFTPSGPSFRKFLALRFDFNLNKNNSVEFVTNQQEFTPSKDFLNSQDERFPGFPFYTQGSVRDSYTVAVRSTLTNSIINEARYATSVGESAFSPGISPADFAFQGGYNLNINSASFGGNAITTATARNSFSTRSTPTYDFTDSLTWIKGSHSFTFGGQYKTIKGNQTSIGRIVPSVSFGLDSTDSAFGIFNTANLPGATATQLTEARNLYAVLVGRVSTYFTNAYLTADGTYAENAAQTRLSRERTYGLFAQDSWRIRPNLTINYGLRWQPQSGIEVLSDNFAKIAYEDLFGVSGVGNIFMPGTLTGRVPTAVAANIGDKAYPDDINNFAPSVGVVWSPEFGESGLLHTVFGGKGKSVFRGGYSVSFVREGLALLDSIYGSNPGGSLTLTRSLANGNLTVGSNLRTAGNPNLTAPAFPTTPSYPITLTTAQSTNVFDPNLKTGEVRSFSFGYQRELDKNTVVEFRYVGNRGVGLQRQYNINEFNTIENGFAAEFALAQANLYANIAAGRGNTFAYFGAGTNTSPLPIILSYFNTPANYAPNTAARYSATNFTNSTLVAALSRNDPNILGFSGTSFENSASRRVNSIANGYPSNIFYVNPTTGVSGAYTVDNSTESWYDSGVIELRRRLSGGLRLQANYVWSKAQSNAYSSNSDIFAGFTQRANGLELAKNVQAFDIRHAFKIDATYDLPFGRGRQYFSNTNRVVDSVFGGWTILPALRWQSGSPFSLGNVQLVGMTKEELQKEIKVRKGPNVVTFLPDDIILNTQRAFDISVTNTNTNGGYGTTYGTGGPTGRFIAPAGYGNCVSASAGDCGFNNLILYGPGFFKLDVTMAKKFRLGEKRNIELKATLLDALNHPNFRIGGWNSDIVNVAVGGATFGQLGNGSAYQDISTTNDPGGRLIDLTLRFNF
ncbi:MAG: TonB-dependent receptor domain-containing protein [Aridibacter sp.]